MPFPLIAAGLAAGGSIVSNIMQNKAAKKQNRQQILAIQRANQRAEKREDTRIQRVVKDARAAGIHPLAALGSPTVGSFATPQAAYGGQPISGSAIGDAMQTVGNAVGSYKTNTDNLQEQLMRAQIANVNASTQQMLADATSRSSIGAAQGGPTRLAPFGDLVSDPGFSTAQKVQDTYGDIAENIFGTMKFLHDVQEQRRKLGHPDPSPAVEAGRNFNAWFQKHFGVRPAY